MKRITYKVKATYSDGAIAVGYHLSPERARDMLHKAETLLGKVQEERVAIQLTTGLHPYLTGTYIARDCEGSYTSGSEA